MYIFSSALSEGFRSFFASPALTRVTMWVLLMHVGTPLLLADDESTYNSKSQQTLFAKLSDLLSATHW